MDVLFLIPAPLNISPGQRFRFEHYLPELKKNGINYTLQSFWSLRVWNILFNKGHFFLKSFGLIKGFVKRFISVASAYKYDYVFIYREAAPVGPPFLSGLLQKFSEKRLFMILMMQYG